MAGVHRSLQFPSLSAQPCAPASALLKNTHLHVNAHTHLKQTTAPRPEPRRHRLTLSYVNAQRHVKLYNVLNCHLDNTLAASATCQLRAPLLLSILRMASEHSAPLWTPGISAQWLSKEMNVTKSHMIFLIQYFLFFLQLKRSTRLKRTDSMQHRKGRRRTLTTSGWDAF